MAEIEKINLGMDSTGKGGDSQRTAFEKCNDNIEILAASISEVSEQIKNINSAGSDISEIAEQLENIKKTIKETVNETVNEVVNDVLVGIISNIHETIDTTKDDVAKLTDSVENSAAKGENSDITALNGLKHNIIQPADASEDMGSVTLRQLNAKLAESSDASSGGTTYVVSDFIGSIQWFNGSRAAIPAGYVAADGQVLSRADYPELWDMLSRNQFNIVSDTDWLSAPDKRASFSSGDEVSTFRMPDINGVQQNSLKGLFIRGDGYAASGTVNRDAIRNIVASLSGATSTWATGSWDSSSGAFYLSRSNIPVTRSSTSQMLNSGVNFSASRVVPTADENRPVSANFIAIIRVKNLPSVDTRNGNMLAKFNTPTSLGSCVSFSDKRLKTNLKVIGSKVNILDQCQSFRGYTYKRKTNNRYEAGFLAQDIKKVLPESVFTNQDITLDDGTVVKGALSLDYGAMSAYNHECILALISKINELTEKIKRLEGKQEADAGV